MENNDTKYFLIAISPAGLWLLRSYDILHNGFFARYTDLLLIGISLNIISIILGYFFSYSSTILLLSIQTIIYYFVVKYISTIKKEDKLKRNILIAVCSSVLIITYIIISFIYYMGGYPGYD